MSEVRREEQSIEKTEEDKETFKGKEGFKKSKEGDELTSKSFSTENDEFGSVPLKN
jgi:hypothetical protein